MFVSTRKEKIAYHQPTYTLTIKGKAHIFVVEDDGVSMSSFIIHNETSLYIIFAACLELWFIHVYVVSLELDNHWKSWGSEYVFKAFQFILFQYHPII